jgi:hypothetical protein
MNSARKLLNLRSSSSSEFAADLERTNAQHALTKINILGLLSAAPRDFLTGQPIDASALFERSAPLTAIINSRQIPYSRTIANRIVTPSPPHRPISDALIDAEGEVSESHLITADTLQYLRDGNYQEFLALRADTVRDAVNSHVDRMAEWGARDSQAISDIIRSVA